MPLTVEDMLEAVNAVPGITKEAITKTLMIGGLTTRLAEHDARIASAKMARNQAAQETEAVIQQEEQARQAIEAKIRSLIGA